MPNVIEGINSSLEKGFPTFWIVSRAYKIQEGVLIRASGEPKRQYAPIPYLEIPSEIAKLQRGDEIKLLNFVNSYGELGYVRFNDRPKKNIKGDDINWIWTHAQTIHLCLELIHVLKNKNNKNGQLIKNLLSSERYRGEFSNELKMASGSKTEALIMPPFEPLKNEDLINLAESVLRFILNRNLQNLHPKVVSEEGGPQLRFTFSALVEVAYWHLANTYVGGCLKRCEACGALFRQTDQRQQFCPKGLRKESLCASRERLRRFRDDRKEKPSKRNRSKSNKGDKRKGGEPNGTKRRKG